MPDLVVVGAGPVGSLLALLLARQGHAIDVYERRPDMRRVGISAGRSINLAVSTRGLHALHEVGLDDDVLREAVPMLGRMTHALDGKLALLAYGRSEREFINSMSRGELNKLLMTRAEETGRVRIHFGQRLVDYDFARGVARFDPVGEVLAEVIVGSDGSSSALRACLAGSATQDVLSSGYKELTMPPRARGFARFGESRKTDTDAIADLAVENFVEMRDKVADPEFLRMREIEHGLQQRMPGRYLTRYQLVTFTRVPYRIALLAGEIQLRILSELAQQAQPDYERGVHLAEQELVPLLRSHGVV